MAAAIYLYPFVLKQKEQKLKADIMDPTHIAGAPPLCLPGPRTHPIQSLPNPVQETVMRHFCFYTTLTLLAVIAGTDP